MIRNGDKTERNRKRRKERVGRKVNEKEQNIEGKGVEKRREKEQ